MLSLNSAAVKIYDKQILKRYRNIYIVTQEKLRKKLI